MHDRLVPADAPKPTLSVLTIGHSKLSCSLKRMAEMSAGAGIPFSGRCSFHALRAIKASSVPSLTAFQRLARYCLGPSGRKLSRRYEFHFAFITIISDRSDQALVPPDTWRLVAPPPVSGSAEQIGATIPWWRPLGARRRAAGSPRS